MLVIPPFCTNLIKKAQSIALVGPMDLTKGHKAQLTGFDLIIYIDGGNKHYIEEVPAISLGDGDSANKGHELDIKLETTKDFSDFKFSLMLINDTLSNSSNDLMEKEIACYGLSKGRLDHELAVLSDSLNSLMPQITVHGKDYQLIKIQTERHFNFKGAFSLIVTRETDISLQGEIEFKLENETVFGGSRTISNNAHGSFMVTVSKPIFLMKFRD